MWETLVEGICSYSVVFPLISNNPLLSSQLLFPYVSGLASSTRQSSDHPISHYQRPRVGKGTGSEIGTFRVLLSSRAGGGGAGGLVSPAPLQSSVLSLQSQSPVRRPCRRRNWICVSAHGLAPLPNEACLPAIACLL